MDHHCQARLHVRSPQPDQAIAFYSGSAVTLQRDRVEMTDQQDGSLTGLSDNQRIGNRSLRELAQPVGDGIPDGRLGACLRWNVDQP
jgi:hypothetical protein